MYGLSITTQPAAEPVTLTEAKTQLGIAAADTSNDTKITALISAARRHFESRTHRALIHRTLTFTSDYFPSTDTLLALPWAPLSSVTSVKYYDADGNQQTWNSANYLAITNREPGGIALKYGVAWPTIRWQPQAVEIVYVAGHAASVTTAVPQEAIHAIKILIDHWFEATGVVAQASLQSIPFSVEALIEQCRVGDDFLCYGEDRFLTR